MIYQLADKRPSLAEHSFIAPSADVIGDVRIAGDVSIWFNVTLRGDDNYIEIGEGSNVQDNTVVHVAHEFPTIIGKEVTIGHGAIIHGCTIEDHCLIAMGAIILNGATIGAGSIVAAGAMVGEGKVIPQLTGGWRTGQSAHNHHPRATSTLCQRRGNLQK